jgi:hypothetical protein
MTRAPEDILDYEGCYRLNCADQKDLELGVVVYSCNPSTWETG